MRPKLLHAVIIVGIALVAQTTGTDKELDRTLLTHDKPAPATDQKTPGESLVGTWVLAGEPGNAEESPQTGSRLLHLTGKHWVITQPDPSTGVTVFHHGGTYTLDGNEYAETVLYANQNTADLIKQTFKFTVKVEGDTLTKVGIGNPWSEVWKRVK